MSVMGKKPFIAKALNGCSQTQLKSIHTLMNNLDTATPTFISLNPLSSHPISSADKGVTFVSFRLNDLLALTVSGILVYTDTECALFGQDDGMASILEYDIDPVKRTYKQVYENLTVEELRRTVEDKLIEKGEGDYVSEEELEEAVSKCVKFFYINEDYDTVSNQQDLFNGIMENCKRGDIIRFGLSVWDIGYVDSKSDDTVYVKLFVKVDVFYVETRWIRYVKGVNWEYDDEDYNTYTSTQLYKHLVSFKVNDDEITLDIISTSAGMVTDSQSLQSLLVNAISIKAGAYTVAYSEDEELVMVGTTSYKLCNTGIYTDVTDTVEPLF